MGLSWGLLHLCHCCLEPDNPLSWAALCGEREDVCPPPGSTHGMPRAPLPKNVSEVERTLRTVPDLRPPPPPPQYQLGFSVGSVESAP